MRYMLLGDIEGWGFGTIPITKSLSVLNLSDGKISARSYTFIAKDITSLPSSQNLGLNR